MIEISRAWIRFLLARRHKLFEIITTLTKGVFRYFSGVPFAEFADAIELLNKKGSSSGCVEETPADTL